MKKYEPEPNAAGAHDIEELRRAHDQRMRGRRGRWEDAMRRRSIYYSELLAAGRTTLTDEEYRELQESPECLC